jgi:hypothetical protein
MRGIGFLARVPFNDNEISGTKAAHVVDPAFTGRRATETYRAVISKRRYTNAWRAKTRDIRDASFKSHFVIKIVSSESGLLDVLFDVEICGGG